jgi:tripartite-type tricarboxylate transporter receptor subunit TctC
MSMITKRGFLSLACGAGLAAAPAGWQPARSQAVRSTARLLVGFPPGGSTDVIARLLASEMKNYALSVIVENRPGAGGQVALEALKGAPSDGSAFIVTPIAPLTLYPHVFKRVKYDPLRDFVPVTTVSAMPYVLTVGPKVPPSVKTLADFISWCRSNPEKATYGSPAAGSPLHFTGIQLARAAGFTFVHVPYQGTAPATQELLGGQIASTILTIDTPLPHIMSGNLRALLTTGPQRSPLLPDVPTIREAGYAGLEAVERFGVFLPASSSSENVERLSHSVTAALKANDVKAGFARLSVDIDVISHGDFARLIKSDFERWASIVRASGFVAAD